MANIHHRLAPIEGLCGSLPLVLPGCVGVITLQCQPDYVDRLTELACHRAHKIDDMPGFLGLYVLAPLTPDAPHLAVTHWQDTSSYEAWLGSPAFAEGMNDLHADIAAAELAGRSPPVLVGHATYKIVTL